MPHMTIVYTSNVDQDVDMKQLCRTMADAMLACRDENGGTVFPIGGVRVLAYPAPHFAVSDGSSDAFGFVYFNVRINRGRSEATKQSVGKALSSAAREFLEPLLARRPVGLTLQIDEGRENFDAKFGNLHDHFAKKT